MWTAITVIHCQSKGTPDYAAMGRHSLKRRLWELLVAIHSDVRVAAFLQALAVIGIYGGLAAFVVGVNPFVTPHLAQATTYSGNTIGLVGMAGLLIHVWSLVYYFATRPTHLDDDFIRY